MFHFIAATTTSQSMVGYVGRHKRSVGMCTVLSLEQEDYWLRGLSIFKCIQFRGEFDLITKIILSKYVTHLWILKLRVIGTEKNNHTKTSFGGDTRWRTFRWQQFFYQTGAPGFFHSERYHICIHKLSLKCIW